ncbi:hypothetical protein [Cetobacterium sp. SF1]|uniref:hypothetical protein n=1 Tax=Cetobacterium sp. SF1 TaxID=3417654 RepID=UPI003CF5FA7A
MKKFILGIVTSFMLISCNEEQSKLQPEPQPIIGGIARESTITINEILEMKGTNQYKFYNDLIFEKMLSPYNLGLKKDEFDTNAEYKEKVKQFEIKKEKSIQTRINSYVIEERRINMKYNPEKQRWESEIGDNCIYSLSTLNSSNSSYKNATFDSGSYSNGFINNSYVMFHTSKKIFFDEARDKARSRGSLDIRIRLICSSKGIKKVITHEKVKERNVLNGEYYTNYRHIVNTNVLAYALIDDKTGEVLKKEIF